MNKIIHIFRRGDRICNIAKQYKTTPYKILSDNNCYKHRLKVYRI